MGGVFCYTPPPALPPLYCYPTSLALSMLCSFCCKGIIRVSLAAAPRFGEILSALLGTSLVVGLLDTSTGVKRCRLSCILGPFKGMASGCAIISLFII